MASRQDASSTRGNHGLRGEKAKVAEPQKPFQGQLKTGGTKGRLVEDCSIHISELFFEAVLMTRHTTLCSL